MTFCEGSCQGVAHLEIRVDLARDAGDIKARAAATPRSLRVRRDSEGEIQGLELAHRLRASQPEHASELAIQAASAVLGWAKEGATGWKAQMFGRHSLLQEREGEEADRRDRRNALPFRLYRTNRAVCYASILLQDQWMQLHSSVPAMNA